MDRFKALVRAGQPASLRFSDYLALAKERSDFHEQEDLKKWIFRTSVAAYALAVLAGIAWVLQLFGLLQ